MILLTDLSPLLRKLADQPMREPMTKLAGFLGRRRRWVLAGWVPVLALALPLASRQTEHLTGGGFDVPGSQSKAVSDSLQRDFGGRPTASWCCFKADARREPRRRAPRRSAASAAPSPGSTA